MVGGSVVASEVVGGSVVASEVVGGSVVGKGAAVHNTINPEL